MLAHVLSELVLVALGTLGAVKARTARDPARIYWLMGIGMITLTAALGALRYAGVPLVPVHELSIAVSRVVGIAGLLAGAVSTFWISVPSLAFAGVLLLGLAAQRFGLGLPFQGLAMLGIVVAAFAARASQPRAAALAFTGVLVLALGQPLSELLPEAGPVAPMDGFHLALGIALWCLGSAAGAVSDAAPE